MVFSIVVGSLLAEVSHGETKMRGGKDLVSPSSHFCLALCLPRLMFGKRTGASLEETYGQCWDENVSRPFCNLFWLLPVLVCCSNQTWRTSRSLSNWAGM